jgi:hypothetical protein
VSAVAGVRFFYRFPWAVRWLRYRPFGKPMILRCKWISVWFLLAFPRIRRQGPVGDKFHNYPYSRPAELPANGFGRMLHPGIQSGPAVILGFAGQPPISTEVCPMAFSLSQTAPSGGRRKSPARALGAASLLLCALSATTGVSHAVVTVSISEFDTPVPLGLDPTVWTNWSSTCRNAGGTGCNPQSAPSPDQSNALFSWNTEGKNENSRLEVTYTGPSRTLDRIRFKTTGTPQQPAQALGPGPNQNGEDPIFRWAGGTSFTNIPYNPSTGVGTMVAYEPFDRLNTQFQNDSTFLIDVDQHFVTEQRMNMSIAGSTTVTNWMVAVDPSMLSDPNFNATFAKAGGGGFQPHFIDNEFRFTVDGMAGSAPISVTLNTGDVIEFLFYESVVQNQAQSIVMPDAYYGDFTVTLIGTAGPGPTPNPVPGTALLIGAGIFGLGFRRSLSLPRLSRRRND